MIPAFPSMIAMAHDLPGLGQFADVYTYEAGTRTVQSSQPLVWTAGANHYIVMKTRTGAPTAQISVTRGNADDQFVLANEPGINVLGMEDDADLKATMFLFGPADTIYENLKMKAVRPRGDNSVELMALIDDKRVHDVDIPFLPGAGEVQDVTDYGLLRNVVLPAVEARM